MSRIFEKYLLVSDFDGTLIDTNGEISAENIGAIRSFRERGGLFSGATGRTQKNLGTHLENLPTDCPWILYNGAAIYSFESGKFLYTRPLKRSLVTDFIASVITRFPKINVQIYTEEMLYLVNPEGDPDALMEAEGHEFAHAAMNEIPKPWLKVLFQADKSILLQIESMIEAELEARQFSWFYSAGNYLEITDARVSKGEALRILREMLGDQVHRIIAIGDYYNDVQMLLHADVSAAPSNAPREILALADMIMPNHNHHAIQALIRRMEQAIKDGLDA